MAKPILVLRLPPDPEIRGRLQEIKEGTSKAVDNEYHILIITAPEIKSVKVDVYNADNCPDADIRKIEELIESQWPDQKELNT